MADELPPNLEPEEVPGGPAINDPERSDSYGIRKKLEPKKNFSQRFRENREKLADKGKDAAKDQAKKAVSKVIRQAIIQAVRAAAVWAWGAITAILGPYAIPIVIVVLAIILIVVSITVSYGNRANKGLHGLSQTQAADKYNPSVIGDIRVVLGDQYMVSNNPEQNYFSQGDPAFNKESLQGSWPSGANKLAQAGCGITACAMMMRYYGVTDITPVDFANQIAKEHGGSLNLVRTTMLEYVNPIMKSQGKPTKAITGVAHNAQAIAKYIQAGDPVLAHGDPICESAGEHYVLIVGISKDFQNFVISDPAAGKPRQSAARYCTSDNLLSHIIDLSVLR